MKLIFSPAAAKAVTKLPRKEGAGLLEKLQQVMDPKYFFRLNRKVICSIVAIKEIKTYLNSRLKITLEAGKYNCEAIVSRERVQAFKEWAEA